MELLKSNGEKKNPDRIYNQPNKNETNQMIQTIKSPIFQSIPFVRSHFFIDLTNRNSYITNTKREENTHTHTQSESKLLETWIERDRERERESDARNRTDQKRENKKQGRDGRNKTQKLRPI